MMFVTSTQPYIPFKDFFALTSFISSLTTSISISASLGLSTCKAFQGRTDDAFLNEVYRSANLFAWSGAIHGSALILSLLFQLLFTSPSFVALLVSGSDGNGRIVKKMVAAAGWVTLGMVAGATALIGEGLKIVDVRVGALLQWVLLGFGLPILVLWLIIRPTTFNFESEKAGP